MLFKFKGKKSVFLASLLSFYILSISAFSIFIDQKPDSNTYEPSGVISEQNSSDEEKQPSAATEATLATTDNSAPVEEQTSVNNSTKQSTSNASITSSTKKASGSTSSITSSSKKKSGSGSTTTTPPPTSSGGSTTVNNASASNGQYIVGYYGSWASYSGYTASKIPATKLTHINYAFAKLNSDFTVSLASPTTDAQNIAALNGLKQVNSKLKIILSIGGWDYSTYFSSAAATESNREKFAQSCLSLVNSLGIDGIDIDWEYPVSGGPAGVIHSPYDKQNFTSLLSTVRAKFNAQTAVNGKKYYLTIAGALDSYLNKIEPSNIASIVDYIFIMGYDIHGSWDKYADFNAPLYTLTNGPSTQYQTSVNDSIKKYLNAGVSASKLVLGMPFYGNSYAVTSSANNGLFSTFTASKSLTYSNIVSNYLSNPAYSQFYDQTARVPYLYGNNTFITYENQQSITEKAQLAKSYGLAGVGAWELSQDYNFTLLSAAYNVLY